MLNRELTAATLTPAVLAILADGDSYGYEIIKRLHDVSHDEIEWAEGVLYPTLHRLERQGYISSYWQTGESRRKRKYYRLNADGRKQLSSVKNQWMAAHSLLAKLFEPDPCLT